jgi:hypothetical protein
MTTNLQPYFAWLDSRLNTALAILPYALPVVSGVALFLLAICFAAWRREARSRRALEVANADRDAALVVTRTALENEIKWRLAGIASDAQVAPSADDANLRPLKGIYDIPPRKALGAYRPEKKLEEPRNRPPSDNASGLGSPDPARYPRA